MNIIEIYQQAISRLNQLFYEHDPAGTCCKENEMKDEYMMESKAIISKYVMVYGKTINEFSVEDVQLIFTRSFMSEYDSKMIEQIFPQIKDILES